RLVTKERSDELLSDLGPEPLDKSFTFDEFLRIISKRRGAIKKALMDQKVIAGIGNIYADEILWLAKVNPFRTIDTLSQKELKEIYNAIAKVLVRAIKLRGTSTSDFRDPDGNKGAYGDQRKVYRMTGQPCPRDGHSIERKTLGGRGTHFCPVCQL
ncbi:MAG: Fpg/Nei family DNA glycosylase, partial [Actinobacteria bacterium]